MLSYKIDHVDFDLDLFDTIYVYYGATLIYRGFLGSYKKIIKNSTERVDMKIE